MRTLLVIVILVIAGSLVACSKLYFEDQPGTGKLTGPDASTYPPDDAGLPDNGPADADNGCGNGDGGVPYPDAPCCSPADAGGNWPPADAPGNWPPGDGGTLPPVDAP
jgi:hypothetical protein